MKNCTKCKYAEWEKTKNGRLHPNGEGRCNFKIKLPKLPPCMFWVNYLERPGGGRINRHKDFNEDCIYYQESK